MKKKTNDTIVTKRQKPYKKFKQIPTIDRPREKMLERGVKNLSNLELIAAILGNGVRNRDIYEIASDIACAAENNFSRLNVDKLQAIDGVGIARACQIMAAVEFARRFIARDGIQIQTRRDAVRAVADIVDKPQEYFLTLTLDGDNNLIQKRVVFIGTLNQSLVHPREIFSDAISDRAASIIVAHNHPSNNTEPSKIDFEVTAKLAKVGKFIGIEIADHIIVSPSGYYSFQESGYLKQFK